MERALIDDTPDLQVDHLQTMEEKLKVFYTLEYPASTWFYHNVIGIGKEAELDVVERLKFLKHLCENDLYYFARYILKFDKLRERPNRIMAEKIMLRQQPGEQERKLICEPRNTYKTTLGSITFPVWSLVKNPNICVQVDSETDKQAHTIYQTIKEILTNNFLLKEMYGKFRTDRWNETELCVKQRNVVRRDPSLYHSGVDSSTNGFHPDIIVVDDPISEQNIQNLEQIEKVYMHVRTLTPLLQRDGEILFILTRWRIGDLVEKLEKYEKDVFSVWSVKSCYGENGEGDSEEDGLYAPEILSKKFLDKAKKLMGMYLFSANYLNNPKPDTDKSFQLDWLNFYEGPYPQDIGEDGKTKKMALSIYMSIDACYADQHANTGRDPTAIVVVGFNSEGDSYLLDVFNKRISPTEVIDQLFLMADRWDPIGVVTEDVNTQKTLNVQIEEEMAKRMQFFPLVRVKHQHRSKVNRIMGLQPIFENRTFYIQESMEQFKDQYMYFSPIVQITHDDILDALEMLETEFRKVYKEPEENEEEFLDECFEVYDRRTGRM